MSKNTVFQYARNDCAMGFTDLRIVDMGHDFIMNVLDWIWVLDNVYQTLYHNYTNTPTFRE